MADAKKNTRRRRVPGPLLPTSTTGLLAAMRALAADNPMPIDAWHRERSPILRDALQAWTKCVNLADRLVSKIVAAAWEAVRTGRDLRVRTEIGWMAGVARRARAKILQHERPIGDPLPPDLSASAPSPLDHLIREENRQRVARVIAILPERHRLAVTLRHILDFPETEVAAVIEQSFGIRFEGTRQILKDGRDMVRVGLEGRDPRLAYPNRYAREKNTARKTTLKYTPRRPPGELHG